MRHRSLRIPHRSGRQDELPLSAPRSPSTAVPSRGLQETKQSMWGWRGPPKSCLSPQHKLLLSLSLKMQLTGRHRAQGKKHRQGEWDIQRPPPKCHSGPDSCQGGHPASSRAPRPAQPAKNSGCCAQDRMLEHLTSHRATGRNTQPSLGPPAPGPWCCLSLPEDAVNASCVYPGHVQL